MRKTLIYIAEDILDYLDWRGDITFERAPFNEVDNLILACFSYLDLDEYPREYRMEILFIWRSSSENFFADKKGRKNLKAESARS